MQQLSGPSLAPASGEAPRQIVVLLHGYGSNGADLISLAPMWRQALPDALFVAPNAPERCSGAPGGYQWWALHDLSRPALAAGALRAAPVLDAYLDGLLAEHGLGEDRMVLVGFSQGTMMALHVGVRRERALAGILGYSGMIAGPSLDASEIRSKPPVLLVHGDADGIVPISAYRHAYAELERHGFPLEGHVSPGLGHGVDPAGIELGARFVKRVLA
ncbi:prolyl oligopeptidase family serine peptidase [Sphingomonas psychrotolerans]|uniref:Prolyl oligopeptidase family serine peptidase n=1 Tax=Sphingomonas psychrotolerans TaxID=1327635 RepID=A0ABU3N317_9SPHN|nr:prolyl oligopeptidase family serine peptidase [Sphingomonas psychrotolerans]MDT8758872.1 prolyl oligopeptidase family serine peptidase [Sphingomonas psychrotolerans]